MQSKNTKQSRIHRLFGIKIKSKLAAAYMDTAVKILICVVCGALFLTGIYGVIQKVVLPKTESSVTSMFAYEAADVGNGGGTGGSGGVETPDVNEEYEMLDGADQTYNTGASYSPLTFRSSAPIDTFQEVKVDGETVDGSNYTVTEGSTIVTFTNEYAQNLATGDHTVEIISNNGSAETDFEISNLIPENHKYYRATELCECGLLIGYSGSGLSCDSCGYVFTEPRVELTEFPKTAQLFDIYQTEDYKYEFGLSGGSWNPYVIDKTKTKYENLLERIGDSYITSLNGTFSNCIYLNDEGLQNIIIPSTVEEMSETFLNCSSIVNLSGFLIPNSCTNLNSSFQGCTSLEVAPNLPDNIIVMVQTFSDCTSLKSINKLPNNVKNLMNTFKNCYSLMNAPKIPESVKYLGWTFYNCENLTGDVEINTNNIIPGATSGSSGSYSNCFKNTKKDIKITGLCSNEIKEVLAGTATNGNVTY